jgi:hypothetical protein
MKLWGYKDLAPLVPRPQNRHIFIPQSLKLRAKQKQSKQKIPKISCKKIKSDYTKIRFYFHTYKWKQTKNKL